MKHRYCLEHEDPKDHKFIKWRWSPCCPKWLKMILMLMTWKVIMCQLGDKDEEQKKGKKQCCNVLVLAESMAKRQKEDTEEKKVQQNLCTMHAKCVITTPKYIQLTHNTHGENHNELWGWSGMITPADETIIVTSEWDATIKDNEMKGQSIEEKMTATHRWILCLLSENEDKERRQWKMNVLLPIWKRRHENEMTKDEFSASYMKRQQKPTKNGLITLIRMKKGMPF